MKEGPRVELLLHNAVSARPRALMHSVQGKTGLETRACLCSESVCSQRLCFNYRSTAYPPVPEACPAAMIAPGASCSSRRFRVRRSLLVSSSPPVEQHSFQPSSRPGFFPSIAFPTHTCLVSLRPLDTLSPTTSRAHYISKPRASPISIYHLPSPFSHQPFQSTFFYLPLLCLHSKQARRTIV